MYAGTFAPMPVLRGRCGIFIFCKMKEESFIRICEAMEEVVGTGRGETDFRSLCKAEGVSFTEADNRMYEEFGMSGDEIIKTLYNC